MRRGPCLMVTLPTRRGVLVLLLSWLLAHRLRRTIMIAYGRWTEDLARLFAHLLRRAIAIALPGRRGMGLRTGRW